MKLIPLDFMARARPRISLVTLVGRSEGLLWTQNIARLRIGDLNVLPDLGLLQPCNVFLDLGALHPFQP
jgi:hypothetical protein